MARGHPNLNSIDLQHVTLCALSSSLCPVGTITVHLQRDSRGHLGLVANPLKEDLEPLQVSPDSKAIAIWQTLQQTANSGSSPRPLAQLAHSLKER